MIGKTLAHYEITGLLGKGGMGEVFRALDTKLGREVAIKILPPEVAGDPERAARFEREARTLANLQHPNVASIYGFAEDGGVPFLAMELVEGEDLAQRLARGPLPLEDALRIAREIAVGLEAAHDKQIVHRDLKPANIKVDPAGAVKILDFGLARAFADDPNESSEMLNSPTITAAMTRVGVILGTAAYMSPEQAKGKIVDRRADIWSFGAILHEMLTGQQLFTGETVSETMAEVMKGEITFKTLPSGTPAHVRALLGVALSGIRNSGCVISEKPASRWTGPTMSRQQPGPWPSPNPGVRPGSSRQPACSPCAQSWLGTSCPAKRSPPGCCAFAWPLTTLSPCAKMRGVPWPFRLMVTMW